VNGEGFFLSAIRKNESVHSISIRKGKNFFQSPSKSIIENISAWVTNPQQKCFILRENLVQGFQVENYPVIELLAQKLHIKSAGTLLATVKHSKLIPEHNLALSIDLNKTSFPKINLSKEEAIQYLKKETINPSIDQKGFSLVTHDNLGLGWANVLDNRINNMYPQQWRIRMAGT
jgi:NOL1/NOP2/fmu family ribosome biogenesis protein